MMDDNFLASLREEYSPRRKYLVAVSGGRDSVALLHMLHGAGFGRLVVCHLNHALRGRASGQDAAFVKRLAGKLGYPCETQRIDVRILAREQKCSLEVAARGARHQFYAGAARKYRCQRIFLGHHADDQVETVLINIFRGSGLPGLAGMRREAGHEIGGLHLEILRPLLSLWRADIDEYLQTHKHRYREDASNQSDFALRNRIRHRLIPDLQHIFKRDVRKAVYRLSHMAGSESEALDELIEREYPGCCQDGQLLVKALRTLPGALQRRVIRAWLGDQGIAGAGFRDVEGIRALIPVGSKVAKINLPNHKHVRRREGRIFIDPA